MNDEIGAALEAIWDEAYRHGSDGGSDYNEKDAVFSNARAAIEAHEARKVPDGWKLVPIEPTKEMIDAYVRDPHRFFSARTDWAAMLASAPPAPQHENETINNLRAGYPAAIDAAIREQASVLKPEPVALMAMHDISELLHCNGMSVWVENPRIYPPYCDGEPLVGFAPLCTHPAPVREPLTQPEKQRLWNDAMYNNRSSTTDAAMEYGSAIEAAHGITKDTPKPRKASADFDLPAPNDDIGDTQ